MSRGFEVVSDLFDGGYGNYSKSKYDGRFYQPAEEPELIRRRQSIEQNLSPGKSGLISLDVYQDWVELDWKVPHGSWAAVERFGGKLVDEELAQEIMPELAIHPAVRVTEGMGKVHSSPTDKLADELGDYLWPMTALASNGTVSLNQAASTYLHNHGLIPRRYLELKFLDLDYILAAGHNPTLGPLDDSEEEDFCDYDPFISLAVGAVAIRNIVERQYGYNDTRFLDGWREKIGRNELEPAIGRALLTLGYVAHQWARTTLSEVAAGNVRKVSLRAAKNLIDKSDGDRRLLEG